MDEFSIAGRLTGSLVGRVLPYQILESLKSCVLGVGRQEISYSKHIMFVCRQCKDDADRSSDILVN